MTDNSTPVSTVRRMSELLRMRLGKVDVPVDIEALRALLDDSEGKALAVCRGGSPWPALTEEGARVVGELIAAFEEQT
jgi:hypothetical protein